MSYLGLNKASKLYLGTTEIAKAYLGDTLVYPNTPIPVVIGGDWQYYIPRGLTLLLDGKEKGPDNTAWISKKNDISFANHGATFNSDHVYFDGTDDYLQNTTFSPTASGSGTIETVIDNELLGSRLSLVFMGRVKGGLGFGENSSKQILWSCGSTGQAKPTATLAKASFSIRKNGYYQNGVSLSASGSDYWGQQDSRNWIGRRNTGQYFKGKIYSIRMYNRQLIKDEVLRNLSVDNIRFSLGLTSYTPVEYIQTNGAVNMIFYLSGIQKACPYPLSCEMKVLCKPNSNSTQYVCGVRHKTGEILHILGINTAGNAFAGYNTESGNFGFININSSLNNETPFIVKTAITNGYQSLSIKQDGESDFTTATGSISGDITPNAALSLFSLCDAGNFGDYAAAGTRVYYVKIYSDTTFTNCIFDGIPCVYFGQYGLWDNLTNTFNGMYASGGTLTGGSAT